jgi:hypothetical protein
VWHIPVCPQCLQAHDLGAGIHDAPAFAGERATECGLRVYVKDAS